MSEEEQVRAATRQARLRVYALVRACPLGRVTTYGWLAAAVGLPGNARLVGWIMAGVPAEAAIPAHRVVNAQGVLTGAWAFGPPNTMESLLKAEGVTFDAKGRVVMKAHAWDPLVDLDADERDAILAGAEAAFADVPELDEGLPAWLRGPESPFRPR